MTQSQSVNDACDKQRTFLVIQCGVTKEYSRNVPRIDGLAHSICDQESGGFGGDVEIRLP